MRWGSIRNHLGEGRSITKKLDALRIDRDAASSRGRGRGLLWAVVLLFVAAAIVIGAMWLRGGGAPEVRTATVTETGRGSGGSTVLNASGYVTARRQATVSSKITGKVVEVRIEEGMAVRENDVVARLDDSRAQAVLRLAESRQAAAGRALDETRSQLRLAELTLRRTEKLVADGVSGQAELDEAETGVQTLQARLALQEEEIRVAEREVRLRRTELEETVIRAPFDGVVISKDAQPGEMVSPVSAGGGFTRTGICTVVDMSSLEIEVDVNESYISRVESGQRVEALLDAYPDWRIPAHVITTIPAADRQKATVLVRIGFDQLDPRILPDMGVKVAVQETVEDNEPGARVLLLVPASALRRDGGRDVVFVVTGETVERRAVTVDGSGGPEPGQASVLSGLTAGEKVVIEGPDDLADGDQVRVR
jgi:RND family efflux transporter MFP subunit